MQSVSVGNRVKEARQASGLTQQALAGKAGIALRTLSLIESGEDTRLSTLAAIAAALDLSITDLLVDLEGPGAA